MFLRLAGPSAPPYAPHSGALSSFHLPLPEGDMDGPGLLVSACSEQGCEPQGAAAAPPLEGPSPPAPSAQLRFPNLGTQSAVSLLNF